MEEDIKIIEKFCKNPIGVNYSETKQAIENLLTRYKQLEEGCKTCVIRNDLHDYVENSIPTSKVKEKIEEIKKEKRQIVKDMNSETNREMIRMMNDKINEILFALQVLQELLREE